jgi:hypothetical protein
VGHLDGGQPRERHHLKNDPVALHRDGRRPSSTSSGWPRTGASSSESEVKRLERKQAKEIEARNKKQIDP